MVLMSSLLCCTFLLLLSQALGENRLNEVTQGNSNDSLITKDHTIKKRLLDGQDAHLIMYTPSDLQAVFTDSSCRECIPCMERAVTAHKVRRQTVYTTSNDQELLLEGSNQRQRDKRDVAKIAKQSVPKRKSNLKLYTVTKFNRNGEVYVLKVKEAKSVLEKEPTVASIQDQSCYVYKVKSTFPCDSQEGNLILNFARRRADKHVEKPFNLTNSRL